MPFMIYMTFEVLSSPFSGSTQEAWGRATAQEVTTGEGICRVLLSTQPALCPFLSLSPSVA